MKNRKIHLALFENILSPVITNINVEWLDFVGLVCDPDNRKITNDKTSVKQFNCIQFKTLENCADEDIAEWWPCKMVPTGDKEVEPEVNFEHYEERQDYPRRNKNNSIGFDALVLDIDNGITWNNCLSKLRKYEFAAYTTHSNRMDKKGVVCDRFRVVIPTDRLVSIGEWEAKTDALHAKFNFIDPASITVSQPFYLPSCPASLEFYADSKWNQGEFFNFDELPVNIEKDEPQVSYSYDDNKKFELSIDERAEIYMGLLSAPISRNYMGGLSEAMMNCGYSYEEFKQVWFATRTHPDEKKSADQWKRTTAHSNGWANKYWLKNAAKGLKNK